MLRLNITGQFQKLNKAPFSLLSFKIINGNALCFNTSSKSRVYNAHQLTHNLLSNFIFAVMDHLCFLNILFVEYIINNIFNTIILFENRVNRRGSRSLDALLRGFKKRNRFLGRTNKAIIRGKVSPQFAVLTR